MGVCLYGLFHLAGADTLGADTHLARAATPFNLYGLEIGQEAAFGLAGYLSSHAAFLLGKAAALYPVSRRRTFTADFTSSGHWIFSFGYSKTKFVLQFKVFFVINGKH